MKTIGLLVVRSFIKLPIQVLLVLITMFHYETAFAQQSRDVTTDSLLFETSLQISSFGVDENLDLYVVDYDSGHIFRFIEDRDSVALTDAFPGLNFVRPVFLTHSGDSTDRIFVLEVKSGKIFVFPNDPEVADADLFLNIGGRLDILAWEGGLLGLAFHPDYANNGFFYVNYTAGRDSPLRTVLSRFSVSPTNPDQGDPDSELILLEILNPTMAHFGGMIQFGNDGYLYISRGDAHTELLGEVSEAQNLKSLLGKILRIDVDNPLGGMNYGIPPDNPFAGNSEGYREEIWASGLRNPWRFSIDPVTNTLWVGDVGDGLYEEIDIIEKGQNYGWSIMEGLHCFASPKCDTTGLTLPIFEYDHEAGCSIIGGYVYRGYALPELEGAYIYGDLCTGKIWMLRYENVPSSIDPNEIPKEYLIRQNYPNPFNLQTTIQFALPVSADLSIVVYDLLGREVVRLIDSYRDQGYQQVDWNGRTAAGKEVPSGIYIARLHATPTAGVTPEYTKSIKMVLLK